MVFGVVMAGGVGSRMQNADIPKQFLPLGDKPIVMHTVEKFLACAKLDEIFIGVHADWLGYTDTLLDEFLSKSQRQRVHTVAGGLDRNETLLKAIQAIENLHGESDAHIIVTHDAVRPFVTVQMMEENIACAEKYGAVNTVVAAVDTIIISEDGEVIRAVPNRSHMYQVQTPQTFRMSLLKTLYNSLNDDEKAALTDACSICVMRDYPVHLVKGAYFNLKITTKDDYKIAQAMVSGDVLG